MPDIYKYLSTQISIFGSLPTHKVFILTGSRKTKLVFVDNTFMHGIVSDWTFNHSGLDSRKSSWAEEPETFKTIEKIKLEKYRALHPSFITEPNVSGI